MVLLKKVEREIEKVELDLASFNKGVWISKDSRTGKAISFISDKIWGSSEPSSAGTNIKENKEFSSIMTEETIQPVSDVNAKQFSIIANDNGAETIYKAMIKDTKEKAEAQVSDLKAQLEALTTQISSKKKDLEVRREEYEAATKGAPKAKNQALLTNDQLYGVTSTISTTASSYSPIKYFWGNQEEKK